MIDHAARAREILDAAVQSANLIERMLSAPLDGDDGAQLAMIDARIRDAEHKLASLDRLHAAAQVHATLALVEQTRLANLQRSRQMIGQPIDFAETPLEVVQEQMPVLAEIERQLREGLGVNPGGPAS
jgi:paraquat-inducible protein B